MDSNKVEIMQYVQMFSFLLVPIMKEFIKLKTIINSFTITWPGTGEALILV